MANTIKIKRGSNANLPSLNEAELAFTTDTKQLYAGTASGNKELFKDIPFPTGGLTGELLVKKSDADYDAEWKDLLGKVAYKRRIMVGDNLDNVIVYADFPNEYVNEFSNETTNKDTDIVVFDNNYAPIKEKIEYLADDGVTVTIDDDHSNFGDAFYVGNTLFGNMINNTELTCGGGSGHTVNFVESENKSYRHLYIEDPNIRPIKVGDVIGNGTQFYFTFPDDLYTDTRVDWSSQIFNTTGSSGFIYMSMGHMGDDYTIYGYFANTAMETIYQYTNSSIINKSFITCGPQAVREVDSVDDYLGKYVLVDKRTLGNNARKLDMTLDNLL